MTYITGGKTLLTLKFNTVGVWKEKKNLYKV